MTQSTFTQVFDQKVDITARKQRQLGKLESAGQNATYCKSLRPISSRERHVHLKNIEENHIDILNMCL